MHVILYTPAIDIAECHTVFSGFAVRCALPYWLQKFEITLTYATATEAKLKRITNQLYFLGVHDNDSQAVVFGRIYEIDPDGRTVRYVCGGSDRELARLRHTHAYGYASTVGSVMSQLISATSSFLDTSNIEDNGTGILGREYVDEPLNEVFEGLTQYADAQARLWDVWVTPPIVSLAGVMGKQQLHFAPRDYSAEPTWIIPVEQLTQREQAATTWDYCSSVRIYYGVVEGAATSTSTDLISTSSNFLTAGAAEGDSVLNVATGIRARVREVTKTKLSLDENGINFSAGQSYVLFVSDPKLSVTRSISNPIIDALKTLTLPELTATQAQQYGDAYLALYAKPHVDQSFTITARTIQHSNLQSYPLYELVRHGRSTLFVADKPALALDNIMTIEPDADFITAIDYSHDNMTARVQLATPQERLDLILQRAKLVNGQSIDIPEIETAEEAAAGSVETTATRISNGGSAQSRPYIVGEYESGRPSRYFPS